LVAFGLTWAWNTAESSHFLGIPTHVLLTHSLITYIYTHILLAFPLLPSLLCLVSHLEWLHFVTRGR
jgi:hypothetical protein